MLHAEQEELALAATPLGRAEFPRPLATGMVAGVAGASATGFRLGGADPDSVEQA